MWYQHGFQAHITLVERKTWDNARAKTHITRSRGKKKKKKKKKKKHITTFIALGGLAFDSAHTISKRQTCQKEKCMINRLWYGNFHIIPHINPRHPYQPSGWYGCLGLIWCMIWKLPCNNLYLSDCMRVCWLVRLFSVLRAPKTDKGLYCWPSQY